MSVLFQVTTQSMFIGTILVCNWRGRKEEINKAVHHSENVRQDYIVSCNGYFTKNEVKKFYQNLLQRSKTIKQHIIMTLF